MWHTRSMGSLITWITAAGYIGITAAVFVESGLLIGVVLPGDSLLFTAGVLASQGFLNIVILIILAASAAILGDNTGYWLGKRFGSSIFSRPGSFLLNPSHITKAERFYRRHGSRAIVLARFIPVVRTLAPVLAGVGSMPRRTFLFWNIVGGCLWGVGLSLAGYILGKSIPNIDHYLLPIIGLIITLSLLPGLWHIVAEKLSQKKD